MILSLKSTLVLVLSFVLLGGVAVYGLKTTTLIKEMNGGAAIVEATIFPLKLIMMFNKTTYEAGKIVNFTLTLQNIGNETLTLQFTGVDYFSSRVYDENGVKIYELESNWLCIYFPPSCLPPGLATWGNMPWYQPHNLKPGIYQVTGLFISRTLNFTIETPPVAVTLT